MPRVYSRLELCMYYANVFGAMLPNGTYFDSDSGIALAFGRNSISDSDLPSIRELFDLVYDRSDIATIKHLDAQKFDPGKPNEYIARKVLHCIQTWHKPVAAQWELCVAIFQMYGEQSLVSAINDGNLICLWPRPYMDRYSSLDVLNDAHAVFSKPSRQYTYPLLLAHDLHMPRVYMLAEKKWINPIVVYDSITRSFDPKSVQKMTTNPARWYSYEFRARVHHLIHGLV